MSGFSLLRLAKDIDVPDGVAVGERDVESVHWYTSVSHGLNCDSRVNGIPDMVPLPDAGDRLVVFIRELHLLEV